MIDHDRLVIGRDLHGIVRAPRDRSSADVD